MSIMETVFIITASILIGVQIAASIMAFKLKKKKKKTIPEINKGIKYQVKDDTIIIDYPKGISITEASEFVFTLGKYYDLSYFELIYNEEK